MDKIIDDEFEEDMLLRETKLLFPEAEEWLLKIAVKAHINLKGEEFVRDNVKADEYKKKYSTELNYTTDI